MPTTPQGSRGLTSCNLLLMPTQNCSALVFHLTSFSGGPTSKSQAGGLRTAAGGRGWGGLGEARRQRSEVTKESFVVLTFSKT